jgi:hypothetical protein
VQTKQEIAAKGKKAAPVVAGYNTAGTRVWEMTREVQFLDELRGKPGVAQIVGLVTQGKADTSRPVTILLERAHCDLSTLLECAPLPQSRALLLVHLCLRRWGPCIIVSTRADMLCMPHKTA